MISLGAIGSASDAAGYYAKDNYYTTGQATQASAWVGQGAAELGLTGPVESEAFADVLGGVLPDGSIIDARRGEHRPGLDLTFSAPKSLSLLALIGGDTRLTDALKDSTVATLAWVERTLIEARAWDGRQQRSERTGKLVAAIFAHDLNRRGEPQAHVHAVIANATRTADGKWRALRNDSLYDRQHVIAAVHNADLRARVEALGYETVPAKNPVDGQWEVQGVSRETVLAFSARRAEIEAALVGREGTPREREIAALATRRAKTPEVSREQLAADWASTAERIGFEPRAIIDGALAREKAGETRWSKLSQGVRGVAAQGARLAAAMGLTPRDADALVPERGGRLDPKAYAAAQAVASAARHLGEREAAWDRLDLVREALSRGGPVRVDDVEARIFTLETQGLLVAERGGSGRLVTTEGALAQERALLADKTLGDGVAVPILAQGQGVARAQATAAALGLRRLSPRQAGAAALILESSDRVVAVQGVAGAGKSVVLGPVAAVARAEGRGVIGLALANTVVRDLGSAIGAEAGGVSSVSAFLARHRGVLDGNGSSAHVDAAKAALGGTVVLVDEASMLGTRQVAELIRLANLTGVGRLAFVGDVKQLGAIEAGRPFASLQKDGTATAQLPDNLRAKSPLMKTVVAALNSGDLTQAFAALAPVTVAVPGGDHACAAAERWAALPKAEREQTLLIASGRRLRAEANAAAQAVLLTKGELRSERTVLRVLDRVSITREDARGTKDYREGRVVEFRTDLASQGFARGERGVVVGVDGARVRLRMEGVQDRERMLTPAKLPRNLREDAVSIYGLKSVAVHAGDRIRWTDTDKQRGLLNADLARVAALRTDGGVDVTVRDGTRHALVRGDPMLQRLDLAYALNAHMAQGVTAEHGIVVMSAAERQLATAKTFLVAMTRIVDRATLVVDSAPRLEAAVRRNAGEKTSAIEVAAMGAGDTGLGTRGETPMVAQGAERTRHPEMERPLWDQAAERAARGAALRLPQKSLEMDI